MFELIPVFDGTFRLDGGQMFYKNRFLPETVEGGYVIFFQHDTHTPAGTLHQDGRHLHVEPVEIEAPL